MEIPPDIREKIMKSKYPFSRHFEYTIKDGELVVDIDELKKKYLDVFLDVDAIFPPGLIHIDIEDDIEDGVTFPYDGEDEPLPYGDDFVLPHDQENEVKCKKLCENSEKTESGHSDEITESLPPNVDGKLANKKVYGKTEIMELLQCGSQKALNFLKLLFQMKYAIKVGKSYLIRAEDFDRFFEDYKGQKIAV